jgi:hypothetical protein
MKNSILIPWVKVGERIPSNENFAFQGQPSTPFVPCLVWICNPEVPHGGFIDSMRWITSLNQWEPTSWLHSSPNVVTHFIETESLVSPFPILKS